MQIFESQLRKVREEHRREYEDFSDDTVTERVHRVSGAITPASPIPEEENEGRERRKKSKEIFVTQSEHASRDDRT